MSSTESETATTESGQQLLAHLFFSQATDARDRTSAGSLVVAVLLHLLILFLALGPVGHHLLKMETDRGVGTGIGAGPAGGGGGGNEDVTLVALQTPPGQAVAEGEIPDVPPPPPPPPVDMPVLQAPKVPQLAMSTTTTTAPPAVSAGAATGGAGTGSGGGTGPGMGPGSGGGYGGGEGGGVGSGVGPGTGRGRLMEPVADFLMLPPTPTPGSVRGKTIVARLAIDASGLVREVELLPSTGDRGYDQAIRRTCLGWRFRPARDAANRAVAVTYDVSFTF